MVYFCVYTTNMLPNSTPVRDNYYKLDHYKFRDYVEKFGLVIRNRKLTTKNAGIEIGELIIISETWG